MSRTILQAPPAEVVTFAQPSCEPVQGEFGVPPDIELMNDPETREVVTEVAGRLEAAHAYLDAGEETGKAAAKVIKSLGCTACELGNVCEVRGVLEQKIATGKANQSIREKTAMIATAPAWLSVARVSQPGIDPDALSRLAELADNPDKTRAAMESGELDLDQLLGGVTNDYVGLRKKADLPELRAIKNVKPNQPLPAFNVTTKNNDTFTVIDASDAVGFNHPPEQNDYAILASKLLGRMRERDAQGKPQIFNDDQIMQKRITKLGGVPVYELRMNSKNRMYIAVDASDSNAPPRITILGSHGGDDKTQRAFIDVALAS